MKITIKSNLNDVNYFFSSLHQKIQSFVKEWIVPEISNKIKIKITKKKEIIFTETLQSNFVISENIEFNNPNNQRFSIEENNKSSDLITNNFKCFNCGFTISLIDLKDGTCDKCNFNLIFSFYFLII